THLYLRMNVGVGNRSSNDVSVPYLFSLNIDKALKGQDPNVCRLSRQVNFFSNVQVGPSVVDGTSKFTPALEEGLYFSYPVKQVMTSTREPGTLNWGPIVKGGAQFTSPTMTTYGTVGLRLGLLRSMQRIGRGSPDLLSYLDATVTSWNRYRS